MPTDDTPEPAALSTSRGHPHDSPLGARHSLGVRLPLLISALLFAVVTTFLWAAYREVEATLVRAGGDRAKGASGQVARLIERSSQAGMESLRRAAADDAIRQYLQNPAFDTREAARARLTQIATTGPRRIEVWSAAGSRVLEIWVPGATREGASPAALPAGTRPLAAGVTAIQLAGHVVFADAAADVVAEPSPAGQGEESARLGYVVVRSTLSVNPPGILGRLVGDDAAIRIGNKAGGIWTDLSDVVPAPPVDVTRDGVAEYHAADGGVRLGAVSAIRGTPWAVWVEFPRSIVVAPAHGFLRRMSVVALFFVVIGAILARSVSVRITRPLHALVQAADAIAAGDLSRRVSPIRRDETGRLGHAFNAMAADVKETHQQLEARVLERSRALDALRESEAHYRAIVEVGFDCIITIGATGAVTEFNPAAEKTFGYRKGEVLGRELADLIVPPEDRDAHRGELARYLATGESALIGQLIELTAMRSDGTRFPIELAISPIPSDGPPVFTCAARNITERKRMESARLKTQAIEEQHRRSLEASRQKSEFIANMSHELRTPLNAIIGFSELMYRGRVGPLSLQHQEYLGDILTSSKHLLQLINDVLDLSKVESGKMEFRPEPVDLTRLAGEVGDTVRGLAASRRLRLETHVEPDVALVLVDPARLKQILYNYLSNAIKFTPDGGRVCVRIAAEGPDWFRIDVEDTGVGIPADQFGKLFVEFEQLDASVAKQYPGTGLGLALTKRLAEAQGGRVEVYSMPGEGSTFSAILPRATAITQAGDREPAQPAIGNQTVLVVDDDPATLKLAGALLRQEGYHPVCRATGEEALAAAEANPPAVVIVDLVMPDVDGFEFISRLQSFPAGRNVAIVVWTVKDLDASERRRLQASAAAIISKSTGGSQALVEVLRRLLPLAVAPEGTHAV